MNILFLVKFYPPFNRGGSELSSHDLAGLLSQKNHKVTILTPNFGALPKEKLPEASILRFPFPIKFKFPNQQIAPFWTANLIWIFYSTFICFKEVLKTKAEIIHVQNNEFIPAAVITCILTRKKSVATFRDYQAICNLSFCLWHKNKSCNASEYFFSEAPFFLENYVNKKTYAWPLIWIALIHAWLYQQVVKYFAKKIDFKIAVSAKVKQVFQQNDFGKFQVINNPIVIAQKINVKRNNIAIYVGKLSKGKGVDVLFEALPKFILKTNVSLVKIVGDGQLAKQLKEVTKKLKLSKKILFVGQVNHDEALKMTKGSSLAIVPSIWPEPLPRAIIEPILLGTPVVATDVGGNGEIIGNSFGLICSPNSKSLTNALINGWNRKKNFAKKIKENETKLKEKYSDSVCLQYEKLYTRSLR